MANPLIIPSDVDIQGSLNVRGTKPGYARSDLTQDSLKPYPVPMTAWRVWNAYGTVLPATPSSDDLGIIGGTFGTGAPSLQTNDLKNAGATSMYARTEIVLPAEYVDGETVTLRIHAGMLTTVASASATVDVEAYRVDEEAGIGSDICGTAAASINSLTMADKDFVITPTTLYAGDILDVRITVAVNDSGTGTAVIGCIGKVELLCDVKG